MEEKEKKNSRKKIRLAIIFVALVFVGIVATLILIGNIHINKDRSTANNAKDEVIMPTVVENGGDEKGETSISAVDTESANDKEEIQEASSVGTTNASESASDEDKEVSGASGDNGKPNGSNTNDLSDGNDNEPSNNSGNLSGENGNDSKTTESPTTEQPITTESGSGEGHKHNWQPQYKTVHHEEKGHNEKVCVQEAYDEAVYEGHYFCNYCGLDITASGSDPDTHCTLCGPPIPEGDPFYEPGATFGASYRTGRILVDTIHHEAVYETQWVVDEKAYDEKVLTGYKCSCGATKSK